MLEQGFHFEKTRASGEGRGGRCEGFPRALTAVLLRGHLGAHDLAEVLQPLLLVALRLAGEQEAALGRFYGDAVLPGAVAVGAGGQAGGDAVAVILVPQEDLALGKGVLQTHTQAAVWSRLTASSAPSALGPFSWYVYFCWDIPALRLAPTSGSL